MKASQFPMKPSFYLWMGAAVVLIGCGTAKDTGPGELLEAWEQRDGDSECGFEVLAHEGYVGCGIPERLMAIAEAAGGGFAGDPLPAWSWW